MRALCLLLLAACEPSHVVDRSRTPSSTAVATRVSVRCVPVAGSHVKVSTHAGSTLEGELLAAEADELTLLVAEGQSLKIPARDVERAEVDVYANGGIVGLLTLWAIAGTASSLSHGIYFVFSGPSWALLSTAAIVPVAADPDRFVSVTSDLDRLHEYARFPGGLPASFDASRAHLPAPACD